MEWHTIHIKFAVVLLIVFGQNPTIIFGIWSVKWIFESDRWHYTLVDWIRFECDELHENEYGRVGFELRLSIHIVLLSRSIITGVPCVYSAHNSYQHKINKLQWVKCVYEYMSWLNFKWLNHGCTEPSKLECGEVVIQIELTSMYQKPIVIHLRFNNVLYHYANKWQCPIKNIDHQTMYSQEIRAVWRGDKWH